MRHRLAAKSLQRNTKQRQALLKGLLRSLFEHGELVTTQVKAKEVRRLADKLIVRAQKADLPARRLLHVVFGKHDVVNTLVDRVAPAMGKRRSGFTTLTKVGKRRGDNTLLVKLSLVEKPLNLGSLRNPAPKKFKTKPKTQPKAKPKAQAPTKVQTKAKPAIKKAAARTKTKTKKIAKVVKKDKK